MERERSARMALGGGLYSRLRRDARRTPIRQSGFQSPVCVLLYESQFQVHQHSLKCRELDIRLGADGSRADDPSRLDSPRDLYILEVFGRRLRGFLSGVKYSSRPAFLRAGPYESALGLGAIGVRSAASIYPGIRLAGSLLQAQRVPSSLDRSMGMVGHRTNRVRDAQYRGGRLRQYRERPREWPA